MRPTCVNGNSDVSKLCKCSSWGMFTAPFFHRRCQEKWCEWSWTSSIEPKISQAEFSVWVCVWIAFHRQYRQGRSFRSRSSELIVTLIKTKHRRPCDERHVRVVLRRQKNGLTSQYPRYWHYVDLKLQRYFMSKQPRHDSLQQEER